MPSGANSGCLLPSATWQRAVHVLFTGNLAVNSLFFPVQVLREYEDFLLTHGQEWVLYANSTDYLTMLHVFT